MGVMRAAYIEELGPPENIRYGDLPAPRPGPTDVLVDVIATTVNPVDTFVRSGVYATPVDFPFVIGRDLVGRVVTARPGFEVGDLVWCNSLGHAGRQGAAAEQAVVAADRLYHLPDGVSPTDAVAVLHPAATAYLALFTHGHVQAGDTVLVAGAAGNVGSALTVLAVEAGARVIATARDADYCRELGASTVLDYRAKDLVSLIRRECPQGINGWFDTSGRNALDDAVSLLAPRGRIVLLAGAQSRPVLPAGRLYMKDGSVVGFAISNATTAELGDAAKAVNRLLAAGRLRAREVRTMSLSEAATAHRLLENGELHGQRVVLHV